jgi:hypothetical protein
VRPIKLEPYNETETSQLVKPHFMGEFDNLESLDWELMVNDGED